MIVKSKNKDHRAIYEKAIAGGGAVLDPYLTSGMGDDIGDLGDPISDFLGNVKGQISELRMGVTVSAAASTAAAIGVILILLSSRGKR